MGVALLHINQKNISTDMGLRYIHKYLSSFHSSSLLPSAVSRGTAAVLCSILLFAVNYRQKEKRGGCSHEAKVFWVTHHKHEERYAYKNMYAPVKKLTIKILLKKRKYNLEQPLFVERNMKPYFYVCIASCSTVKIVNRHTDWNLSISVYFLSSQQVKDTLMSLLS